MVSVDSLKDKSLFGVVFPVFTISNNYIKTWNEDNITYIQTDSGVYVLDNKNIQGDTLGQRRLRINNSKLYRPRKVIHTISQLIRCKSKLFIDNAGDIFTYKKTKFVNLKYYKVDKLIDNNGCVLHFKEISNPIQVPASIAHGIEYVGFLHTDVGYILYEYSETFKKDTRRKI